MKNYTVKFNGTDSYKVVSRGNLTMQFNKENDYTIDIEKELKEKGSLSPGLEFNNALKKLYLYLIESCECIPYSTVDSSIEAVIDIRNNKELSLMKAANKLEVEKIQYEMDRKIQDARESQEGEVDRLRRSLETEINLAMNEADMERSQWKATKETLDIEENEQVKLKLEDGLKESYQKIQLQEGKWQRLNGTMKRKIADLQNKQTEELQNIRVLYTETANAKRKELSDKLMALADKMEKDRPVELKKIQDIANRVKSKQENVPLENKEPQAEKIPKENKKEANKNEN